MLDHRGRYRSAISLAVRLRHLYGETRSVPRCPCRDGVEARGSPVRGMGGRRSAHPASCPDCLGEPCCLWVI